MSTHQSLSSHSQWQMLSRFDPFNMYKERSVYVNKSCVLKLLHFPNWNSSFQMLFEHYKLNQNDKNQKDIRHMKWLIRIGLTLVMDCIRDLCQCISKIYSQEQYFFSLWNQIGFHNDVKFAFSRKDQNN